MNILECKDIYGITVVCSKDTWEKHIVPKHPEMEGCEAHVKAVIQHPRQIYQDSNNLDKLIIYNSAVLQKASHTRYIRVIINYKKHKFLGKRGYIESALGCWNIKRGDILIWENK
jgi:hypothetical protein